MLQRIVIGSGKSRHCHTRLERHFSWMKTYSESRIELQNLQILKKILAKSSQFGHQSSPVNGKAWTLPWICKRWKNASEKLAVPVNLWHLVWMKGASVTVEMFVFCGWRFSNQFDVVLETHFSCNTVGCELWLAILCSLLCPETDWNIRIRKQDCVVILTDFNKWSMFWRFIPDVNQCVNGYFETGKSWIFLIN